MKNNFVKIICILMLLFALVSCGEKENTENTVNDTEAATAEKTEGSEKPEDTVYYLDETSYIWPADAPENSIVITVGSAEGRKYKVVDGAEDIEYIIEFFETLDKKEILYDKKGGQTISVVINTEDVVMRLSFIGKDKINYMGMHEVDESAYEEFLDYYESLDYPELTE